MEQGRNVLVRRQGILLDAFLCLGTLLPLLLIF